ncbi:ATP-binding cassette domain-containing protein [Mucilaginibacter gotjawali]|uniref:Molybdate transport system ATP-binding protein n=2 Tax=Mucilaginibacter gotjawali TaxID=1550579 RepID=A0A839SKL2_9SPHI|nr:ATP-binding cassette domain-containing protein [Mucilaginibacter gotjawali]MBB3058825.1 molybdate transport system ATP-binding protein [Mucilaginibacter gotjawali]BAU52206.1 Spermidine/putrescine import ATP-binding protein PotA [Mucilaginibacter gotjawali]
MISINIEKKLKTYHGQQVLKIAGHFAMGSITKIYGPSGAGKTTFLKVIAGFVQPEKGNIMVDGLPWLDTTSKISLPAQKRMAGFVFQDYALFPNMTVLEHLEYATKDDSWIKRLLAIGKLETLTTHKPEYLSGGQQQRLAILRALATKPKLLLMDEPFSAIDPKMKTELIRELQLLFKELGTTVFIVSHNLPEVEGLSNGELMIPLVS